MSQTSTVLVTGGAGFIGRWLVAKWLERGVHVVVYDNLCGGQKSSLECLRGQLEFHHGEILDYSRLLVLMRAARPRIIYHLAAFHYIPFCNAHPLQAIRVNVEGTFSVLRAAGEVGAGILVFASSGALYPSKDAPLSEDLEAIEPCDVYGLTKAWGEQACRWHAKACAGPCAVVRLFNTYGPYETNPHLIPHIVELIKQGAQAIQLGNTHTKRDYVYVEDVAEALVAIGCSAHEGFEIFNVGTGFQYSAADIVAVIGKLLGRPFTIQIDPARVRAVDKVSQLADTRKTQEKVGWRAVHSLEEGLRKLLIHEGLLKPGG